MCIELLFALIYFFTIFFINFILYKLLKDYKKNISYLLKIKNIFTIEKNANLESISFFYLFRKNKKKYKKVLANFQKNIGSFSDILLLGNFLKYFSQLKEIELSQDYYFQLLEEQYLFSSNKKWVTWESNPEPIS